MIPADRPPQTPVDWPRRDGHPPSAVVAPVADGPTAGRDLARAPLVLAWEITRACPLRCRHCRANAQRRRDPGELTTAEGLDLIRQAAELGVRILVVTGGDPLARPDVYEFVAAASRRGMHVGFSPSVTARLRPSALFRAVEAGAGTIHLSLDGARAATHDRFRGVTGSFERTLAAIEVAEALPVRLQIGTTVCATVDDLPEIVLSLAGHIDAWSLFFLVPTGRATAADLLSPDDHERVLRWLATEPFPFALSKGPPTAACWRSSDAPSPPASATVTGSASCPTAATFAPRGSSSSPWATSGNNRSGTGYRHHPLFVALRDPNQLGGKCGRCPYRRLCGGSRARAWALTGNPLAADPTCSYEPPHQPQPAR